MIIKSRSYRFGVIAILVTTLGFTADGTTLKEIMRGLQTDTDQIVEGLLIDDFDQVASAAGNIATHPQIPAEQIQLVAAELGTEMPAFKQFDLLVHDLSLSIAAAAKDGDRDRAITDYHQMLDGCFACHAAFRDRVAAVLGSTVSGE
jgi:hypothetical protein